MTAEQVQRAASDDSGKVQRSTAQSTAHHRTAQSTIQHSIEEHSKYSGNGDATTDSESMTASETASKHAYLALTTGY